MHTLEQDLADARAITAISATGWSWVCAWPDMDAACWASTTPAPTAT